MIIFVPCIDFSRVAAQASLAVGLLLLVACGGGGGSGGGGGMPAPTTPTTPPTTLDRPNLANASAANLTVGVRATITFANSRGGTLTGCTVSPTLPTGLTVSRTSGNASCKITGIPSVTRGQTTYRVTATNATGADATPATVTIGVGVMPTVGTVTPTTASIHVPSTTAGTAYVVFRLDDGTAAPTAAAIKTAVAGQGGVIAAGNSAVTAGARATVSLTGLTGGTSYIVYTVVESGGVLGAVLMVDVDTPLALARPNLVNASAASLIAGTRATTILFTNNGGGALTGCTVSPTLPTGLNVSRSTGNASCQITGTPGVAGSQITYTVTATNAMGADATPATVSITVVAALARPNLANASAASLTVGTRASAILFTNNGGGTLTGCTVSPTLPTGLNVSRTTGNASCQITGTPGAVSSGTYAVTATNATGADTTPATVAITVMAAPIVLARPDLANAAAASLIAGTRASAILFTNNGGGGLTGCTVNPMLPTGLNLSLTDDNGSCRITGTPDTVAATDTYTVTATNASGDNSATVSILVNPARPNLANATDAALTAGTSVTTILFTNNGGGGLTGCTVNPMLPTGLNLSLTDDNGSCRITGTPDAVTATDTYTVTATNATGADATPATVSITVNPALPDLADATANLTTDTDATITFVNNGGGTLTGCTVNPPLPIGLSASLTGDNGSCRITGRPTTAQTAADYIVTATNATGADATPATVSITVAASLAQPDLAAASAATLVVGTKATISFSNNGGRMLTGCTVDKTLPTGLALGRTSGNGSCEITGTPDAVTATATYTVTATNATGADATPATVSITVNPARPSLANATAATFIAGTEITAITFANSGGGYLTPDPAGCTVNPPLPAGLDVAVSGTTTTATCQITGNPSAVDLTGTTYTVTATNVTGSDMATVSITVNPALPSLADAPAATLVVGTDATIIFTNNGGRMLTNCVAGSALPAGLSASLTDDNGSCRITGTPEAATAEATYTVIATNATGADATPATVSILVNPARPSLANAAAASFIAGTAITAITFANNGGRMLTNCVAGSALPAGLSASLTDDNGSCRITGTPEAATAEATYTVIATNATGADATPATVSILVNPARPSLANAAAASFIAGTAITAITFANNGGGMLTDCAVNPPLPNGLDALPTDDNASCEITGTPDAATATATYRVTATNATGADSTPATVSITVNPALPDLADAAAATLVAGTEITTIIFANSGGGMLTGCSVNPPLPVGLSASLVDGNASCRITGTPDAATAVDTYTVTAANVTGADATPATVSITVNPALPNLADAPAASLVAGTAITAITFVNGGGGMLTNCAVNPPLPTGLDLDRTSDNASCEITGTPDAVTATATYTVTATNATGADATPATVSITVNPALPNLADAPAVSLTVGTRASAILFINKGGGTLTGCAVSPKLPTGLDVSRTTGNASCQITGIPSVARGRTTYTVTATNATGADATPATVSIIVNPALPNLANASAVSLTVGTRASAILFTNKGGGALTGCTVSPKLPTGLDVSRTTGNASCQITGTPGAVSSGTYAVTATNATGADATPATVSITVNPVLPSLANASAASLIVGTRASAILFINNGGGTLTGCTVSPKLPTGLDVSRTTGNASCQITGTPSVARGQTTYTVTATNASGADATPATVSITVNPALPDLANASAVSLTAGTRASAIPFINKGGGALTGCTVSPTLPIGLDVSRTTGNASCQITGTPGAVSSGTYAVTATNATGADATPATVSITVNPALPNLANASAASNFTTGTRASTILFTNNGGGALTGCTVSPTLPTGLDVSRTTDNASCQITGTPIVARGQTTYTVTATNATGADATPATVSITVVELVDADGDGLIEIGTLAELNNVRYSLDGAGYKTSASATPDTSGCPSNVCIGYELVNDLTFDADEDGSTWTRSGTTVTLDTGDDNNTYLDIASGGVSGGWVPIGSSVSNSFTAVFEGNGHTITGLATARDLEYIGLFGVIGAGADIRNLGLVGNLARCVRTSDDAYVGGLVGQQDGGAITASWATGDADCGATGDVDVGGLVGYQEHGAITASWATGRVEGNDDAGGLVGYQEGTITASYATGNVGGGDSSDDVGGLVGEQPGGSITASWATGDVDGRAGTDRVGSLVGYVNSGFGATITASWGFGGKAVGETGGSDGSNDRPTGVTSVAGLTPVNAGSAWNAAASNTLGAWDFGMTSQTPALNYADYDGPTVGTAGAYTSGHRFHCAGDAANAPDDAILIANCGTLIPGAATAANVLAVTADITVISGTAGTAYVAVLADGAAAPTAADIRAASAGTAGVVAAGNSAATAGTRTTVSLAGLAGDTAYDVYVVVESGANPPVLGRVAKVDLTTLGVDDVADADGDGLIEIGTLVQLNNMRHSLDGAGYKTGAGDTPNITGCPSAGCIGYELMNDLTLDADGDGSTWTRNPITGAVTLDTGDDNDTYFDIASGGVSGGWVPVGGSVSNSFTAVFEGNGHTISGLASAGSWSAVGMFGFIGTGAEIRNLRLDGNAAIYTGSGFAHVGGLAGSVDGADVSNCHVTGEIRTSAVSSNSTLPDAGGLIGSHVSGAIIASSSSANVSPSGDSSSVLGGLVGSMDTVSITASRASGNVVGGGGMDDIGGLVGIMRNASITASWAAGDVDGEEGSDNDVGGLVGDFFSSSITASYATGEVVGGTGRSDNAGGLIGSQGGASTVTASWATGNVSGGAGVSDIAGSFRGIFRFTPGTVTASWGFGSQDGEEQRDGATGSDDRPAGATQASQLTSGVSGASTNVPSSWNAAASNTLGAWDFGNDSQLPALSYADYDGPTVGTAGAYTSGHRFHCAGDSANAPDDAILIPDCGTLISGAVTAANVLAVTADITVISGTAGTAYVAVLADGAAAPTAADIRAASAGTAGVVAAGNSAATAGTRTTVSLAGLAGDTAYDVYVVVESGANPPVLGRVAKVDLTTLGVDDVADADGDGLIEIGTLVQLNNMRHSLDGAGYKTGAGDTPNITGCPSAGCIGYELVNDLDFDVDGDGSTWTRNPITGAVTLDTGDDNDTYFDIASGGVSGGWVPVGGSVSNSFTAVFEGNGHTISGLASAGSWSAVGMFGFIGTGAEIRNLRLDGNAAIYTGSGFAHVGGLAGSVDGADVSNCHVTGEIRTSAVSSNSTLPDAGGLIGSHVSGAIIASSSSANVSPSGDSSSVLGGLVGSMDTVSITASRASGNVVGGGGMDDIGGLVGIMRNASITASWAAGDVDGEEGSDNDVGGLVGDFFSSSITASYATGDVVGGTGRSDNAGGLIGSQGGASTVTASWATGNVSGGAGVSDIAGSFRGIFRFTPGTVTASWGFGSQDGEEQRDGATGSDDRPAGATQASQLTSGVSGANTNVPSSWNAAGSNTLGAWDFGNDSQLPALSYADYDGPTVGTAGAYTSGHRFHCASDAANAPDDAILIPDCGTLIPGQRTQVAPAPSGYGGGYVDLSGSSILGDSGPDGSIGRSSSIQQGLHYASASLWMPEDESGTGADTSTKKKDAGEADRLIATFDAATDDLAAIRANASKYTLTGIFANPTLANWNNYDGEADSAHVGSASVSTWQIGTMMEAQATGSIRINGVAIEGDYINFLMAGGGGDVGVSIYVAGTGTDTNTVLATYAPNFCADKYLKGEWHWAHFDVRALDGLVVDIEIRDHDATSDCGFIAFDHFYQSDSYRGASVGTPKRLALR